VILQRTELALNSDAKGPGNGREKLNRIMINIM
jgi:hypothetical protein